MVISDQNNFKQKNNRNCCGNKHSNTTLNVKEFRHVIALSKIIKIGWALSSIQLLFRDIQVLETQQLKIYTKQPSEISL